jgi:FKBP-type peptidyl-prolyl cis-trans isomerase
MVLILFAATLALQKGAPTTPVVPPATKLKPVVSKPRPHKKKVVIEKPSPVVQVRPFVVDKPAGSGEPVKAGEIVTIQFLVKKLSGEDVADSKKRGLPYTFKIGAPGNDRLLDLVVTGMKPGGVRTQTVAAKDAYGPKGAPPVIAPTDTLIVTITLIGRGSK